MSVDKPAQKFFTSMERSLQESEAEYLARVQKLASAQYDQSQAGGDKNLPKNQQHNFAFDDPNAKKKNFDEKIYMFPPSFNALRSELDTHWPTLFNTVNPELGGVSLAYCMVFDAPKFVGVLNGALDLMVQLDSENIDAICKIFLDALRVKRGVQALH